MGGDTHTFHIGHNVMSNKYLVKNLDNENPRVVRIFKVDAAATIVPSSDFTSLDMFNESYGVGLIPAPIVINCEGAINHAGMLEVNDLTGSKVRIPGTDIVVNSTEELLDVLENTLGLETMVLTEWTEEPTN